LLKTFHLFIGKKVSLSEVLETLSIGEHPYSSILMSEPYYSEWQSQPYSLLW
jgi:hypothetical protein